MSKENFKFNIQEAILREICNFTISFFKQNLKIAILTNSYSLNCLYLFPLCFRCGGRLFNTFSNHHKNSFYALIENCHQI